MKSANQGQPANAGPVDEPRRSSAARFRRSKVFEAFKPFLPAILVFLSCTSLGAVCCVVNGTVYIPVFSRNSEISDRFWKYEIGLHPWCEIGFHPKHTKAVHEAMQTGYIKADRLAITGVLDSSSSTADLYWTFALKNENVQDKEASVLIDLPKNSVISMATLTIDGVPKKAVFALDEDKDKTTGEVVYIQRNPLLITQVAPDRVKLVAAPIAANGGTMQLEVGITVPFANAGDGRKSVSLPRIVESNLQFKGGQDVHLTSTILGSSGTVVPGPDHPQRSAVVVGSLSMPKIFVANPEFEACAARLIHAHPEAYVIVSSTENCLKLSRSESVPKCRLVGAKDAALRISNLWARQEIERRVALGAVRAAGKLANSYRIVSSVSRAVVLDSDRLSTDTTGNFTMCEPYDLAACTNGSVGPQPVERLSAATRTRWYNWERLLASVLPFCSFLCFAVALNLFAGLVLRHSCKPMGWSKTLALVTAGLFASAAVCLPRMMDSILLFVLDSKLIG